MVEARTRTETRTRRRRRQKAGLSGVLAVSILLFLVALSLGLDWLSTDTSNGHSPLAPRGLLQAPSGNEECRAVHRAKDKCAFVKDNCPDEDSGLISYLNLYYCTLPHLKPLGMTIIIIWTGSLFSTIGIAASDFFCINLSTISTLLGMSESLAGVTFLAFGNGSPDVFSTFAAVKSHSGSLAVGELIGAAGFITAVVAGSMAIIKPFKVAKTSFVRDVSFFIVAVAFSMVFMANGDLELWECAVMVGFYVFYVVVVVAWHWWFGNKMQKSGNETSQITLAEAVDNTLLYSDEEPARPSALSSARDLELAARQGSHDRDEELEEDERMEALGELNSNMRVTRAPDGERRAIFNPIRPSLVGALEFRAVLNAIEKEEGAGHDRRYSDIPTLTGVPQRMQSSDLEDLDSTDNARAHVAQNGIDRGRSTLEVRGSIAARGRAVSANDAAGLKIDPKVLGTDAIPPLNLLGSMPPSRESSRPSMRSAISQPDTHQISDTYTSLHSQSRTRSNTTSHLAPPSSRQALQRPTLRAHQSSSQLRQSSRSTDNPQYALNGRPRAHTRTSSFFHIPQFRRPSPRHTPPASPFPRYRDNPLEDLDEDEMLFPPPSTSPEPANRNTYYDDPPARLWRYWPYKYLVSPEIITRTLFPTLCEWHDKNIWDKALGIISAPSFFLLTITLPVVEPPEEYLEDTPSSPHAFALEASSNPEAAGSTGLAAPVNATAAMNPDSMKREWNRWLVVLQSFTSPFFIALILWANNTDAPFSNPHTFLAPALYALATSGVLLVILLFTTTPTQPPRYHFLLCFVGFVVSVTWISTIANEVVGVLKTIGVIASISDAILGLTIFAVGSSLGDLVANITVARLGYPVMALSACFGGPLLNILLGIGLSGLYVIAEGAAEREHKHPERKVRFKPYHVEVSTSLVVSGVSLLVTLVGLLVVVPANGWRMDRKVGWGLIVLWSLATLGNVVVEVMGWGDEWDLVRRVGRL